MKITKQQPNNNPAFTLIELLVVIAIIGILTALAVVSLQNSRRSARDAKRIADVKQIQIALELYYQDNNTYPATLNSGETLSSNSVTYMETIPYPPNTIDGDCSTSSYIYSTSNNNTYYNINFCLSNNVGSLPSGEVIASPRGLGEWTCGEHLVDYRDGQSYTTVQIGSQCWMSENINYDNGCSEVDWVNSSDEGWCGCYDNLESNCDIYGRLYQWSAAMNDETEERVQGICPEGWHVPTNQEWIDLLIYVNSNIQYRCNGINSYIAKSLASISSWANYAVVCAVGNNQESNNLTGFNILPAGRRIDVGTTGFNGNLNSNTNIWLSSENGASSFGFLLALSSINTSNPTLFYKYFAFSVRCLKNN